jgi:hypothetical protein
MARRNEPTECLHCGSPYFHVVSESDGVYRCDDEICGEYFEHDIDVPDSRRGRDEDDDWR